MIERQHKTSRDAIVAKAMPRREWRWPATNERIRLIAAHTPTANPTKRMPALLVREDICMAALVDAAIARVAAKASSKTRGTSISGPSHTVMNQRLVTR